MALFGSPFNNLFGNVMGGLTDTLSNTAYDALQSSIGSSVAKQRGSLSNVSGLDYRLNQHNIDYLRELELMDKANAFSAQEAEKNRQYQTEMSNTAYQRAMADAKAAGVNPALIFSQGGASTPSGSYAHSAYSGPSVGVSSAYDAYASSRSSSAKERASNERLAIGVLGTLGSRAIKAITAFM